MLQKPVFESGVYLFASGDLVLPADDALVIEMLLLFLGCFDGSLPCFYIRDHAIDPLLDFLNLLEAATFHLRLQFSVPAFNLLEGLFLVLNLLLELLLDLEALTVAVLDQLPSIPTVHLDELLCFLVGLVVGAVLGPDRIQQPRVEVMKQHLPRQFLVVHLDALVVIVFSLHNGNGILVFLEDVRGMVLLHVEHRLVRLVQHVL